MSQVVLRPKLFVIYIYILTFTQTQEAVPPQASPKNSGIKAVSDAEVHSGDAQSSLAISIKIEASACK